MDGTWLIIEAAYKRKIINKETYEKVTELYK